MDKNDKNGDATDRTAFAGSKSVCDKINDLSLASLDRRAWGVRGHNDHLWDQIHNVTVAHNPRKGTRPDNAFASVGFVTELMVDEVHAELVDQGMI